MSAQSRKEDLIAISQQLLLATKTGDTTDSYTAILQNFSMPALLQELENDRSKKAFWLNIYNAYTQLLLQKAPDAYKHRNSFFQKRQIVIAGSRFSLDDIEHGILRRSQNKLGLGYLPKIFTAALEKKLRVAKKDYRIHFALNCGARSCPPIAFYDAEKIDEQLMLAERSFLKNDAVYDEARQTVSVSKIFSWFRGDFGGKKGIRQILQKQRIIPANKKVRLKFKQYDWSLMLNAF